MTNKIKQIIGQLNKGVDEAEEILEPQNFHEFCDHAFSCMSLLRSSKKKKDDGI